MRGENLGAHGLKDQSGEIAAKEHVGRPVETKELQEIMR